MNLRTIAILAFIFGAYSRFRIDIGPAFIPYFISFFSGIFLLFLNKGKIHKSTFNFIIGFVAVSGLTFVVSYLLTGFRLASVLQSIIFLIYSVGLSAIFLDTLLKMDDQRLSQLFYKVTITVLIFCLLDIFTPFHQLNVFILDLMGGHNQGEFASNREASYFFGIRRPFPFTQEPSHVSKLLLVLLPGWLILSNEKKVFKFFALSLLSLLIIRSPVILGALGIGVVYLITRKGAKANLKVYVSSIVIVLLLIVIGGVVSYFLLESRINSIQSGGDPSTSIRLIRPFFILKESIAYSPLFGVGTGNTELLAELYLQNYTTLINEALGKGYTISSLLAPFAYWGLVGSFLHIIVVLKYLKQRLNIENGIILFVMYFLLSISMGGFNTIAYWGYLILIFRISHVQRTPSYNYS